MSTTAEKIKKVKERGHTEAMKLIYQWVKGDSISLSDFNLLVETSLEEQKKQYQLDCLS